MPSYLLDVYLKVKAMKNPAMDETVMSHRKARLKELMESACHGSCRELAEHTAMVLDKGISENYVSKMLWPTGKPQSKPIGDKKQLELEKAFGLERGWFDRPLGYAVPNAALVGTASPLSKPTQASHASGIAHLEPAWPFQSITREQWSQMSPEQRSKVEIFAMGIAASMASGASVSPTEKRRAA